ncbi:MAG: UDP-glucose/GDP-mannose dehydrogenase family protein [Alcaligenaceae bacterium]|jgi:UDPglucose 6-dehydrogenase|nr:UDP-glucose/GDP-mannose dehydrogenase family protein [Alcaligenaceae bacterium]
MKVTFFGIGYVGLVQATVFAEVGHEVVCVDIDEDKIARLNEGFIPIYEPGLEGMVRSNHTAGRLKFTNSMADGVAHGELLFIAVGTPPDEDGSADLKYILDVARSIGRHLTQPSIIVNKSTVPVGTADLVRAEIAAELQERGLNEIAFDVVSNPEFLKEGSAVADCTRPDRIVIGTNNPKTAAIMRELYAPFNRNHEKIILMDVRSAELTKYAANGMLATKISFMNEIAAIAEEVGADIESVRQGIGSDPRIGYHFIYAGAGYGGSCFPKDVRALIHTAANVNIDAQILKAVESRNKSQKQVLFQKIIQYFDDNIRGKVFAVWGLSFKPNTDDMREAPSRDLLEALWENGAVAQVYDPQAMDEAQRIYGSRDDFILCGTKEAALKNADALVVMTDWRVFKAPDFDVIKQMLKQPLIFDGRNLYEPDRLAQRGVTYVSIGRQVVPIC